MTTFSYSVASGRSMYVGRQNPRPAWLNGALPYQFVEIPGTNGLDSGLSERAFEAYSGFAIDEVTGTLYVAAWGGHDDGTVNLVASVCARDDAPAYAHRCDASPLATPNTAYYPDGKPASRHPYQHSFVVGGKVWLIGARYVWGSGPPEFPTVDSWDIETETWDAAGTNPDIPSGGGYGHVKVGDGKIWTQFNKVFDTATRTWSTPSLSGTISFNPRWPAAWDSLRNRIFYLQWGDGQGYDPALNAAVRNVATGVGSMITFSSESASAVAAFEAEAPVYAAMDYDSDNDEFVFYCGISDSMRAYRIKPNSGTEWDMSILTIAGDIEPPSPTGAGVNRRWGYIPALKGFFLQSRANSNIYFLPTS